MKTQAGHDLPVSLQAGPFDRFAVWPSEPLTNRTPVLRWYGRFNDQASSSQTRSLKCGKGTLGSQ
jgi:hypothetical protein